MNKRAQINAQYSYLQLCQLTERSPLSRQRSGDPLVARNIPAIDCGVNRLWCQLGNIAEHSIHTSKQGEADLKPSLCLPTVSSLSTNSTIHPNAQLTNESESAARPTPKAASQSARGYRPDSCHHNSEAINSVSWNAAMQVIACQPT
jgi:hypothetical protein